MLEKENYKSTIIFGDLDWEKRDERIDSFRTQNVDVIITSSLFAEVLDVPDITVQIVINFDVPITE